MRIYAKIGRGILVLSLASCAITPSGGSGASSLGLAMQESEPEYRTFGTMGKQVHNLRKGSEAELFSQTGTYYFQTGRYHTTLAGLTHLDPESSSFVAYRFHEADPIFFSQGIRLTARAGEEIDGHVYFDPQPTTYWTYTWTYEW